MRRLVFALLLLAAPALAQDNEVNTRVNGAIAQKLGMLEIASISLQVQLDAAKEEIARLKKDLDAKKP